MRKSKILSKIQPGSSASSSTTATATTKTQRKQPKVRFSLFLSTIRKLKYLML